MEGPQRYKEFVLEGIRCTLEECENVAEMHVEWFFHFFIFDNRCSKVFYNIGNKVNCSVKKILHFSINVS